MRATLVTGSPCFVVSSSVAALWKHDAGSVARSAGGDRDVDGRRHRWDELVQRRGGRVAEPALRAGEQQGGEQAPADRDGVVADRVHAAVDDAQPADRDPVLDVVGRQTQAEKLPARDRAALTARDPRDLLVRATLT